MKILITNFCLATYTGTEVVVRDLALELRRQGHTPLVYSPKLGAIAQEIVCQGIEVVRDLDHLASVPDVIHGQHHAQVVEALLHFPSVPAIYVCHDARAPVDTPFYFPRLLRYVAVDNRCRARIESIPEIPRNRIEIIPNAVDLARFRQRDRLPLRPTRALIFSNYAERRTHLQPVQSACQQMGLALDVVGAASGTAVTDPERILPLYDLVFAKARCALEALACGNAVVLCDFSGAGPMVTSTNFDALRPRNFGQGVLVHPLRADCISSEARKYSSEDAARVSDRVRSEAGLTAAVQRWTALYAKVIEEFQASPTVPDAELLALASYLRQWNYDKRMEWEREQLRRFQRFPIVGDLLHRIATSKLRQWTNQAPRVGPAPD